MSGRPKAEAVAIKGDRIVFVGSNRDVQKFIGKSTRVIDLKGRTVVPGLTDSHQHLSGVGFREMTLNLEGINSLEEFLAKVKARVDQASSGQWVTGRGWIETFWKPPVFPTRAQLDQVAPNNPVILTRADGHASVVNSAALKLANVDRNTSNPFGGDISKGPDGEPNGMLIDAAQGLVRRHIPGLHQPKRSEQWSWGCSATFNLAGLRFRMRAGVTRRLNFPEVIRRRKDQTADL